MTVEEPLRVPVMAMREKYQCSRCNKENEVTILLNYSKEEIKETIRRLESALKLFGHDNN